MTKKNSNTFHEYFTEIKKIKENFDNENFF